MSGLAVHGLSGGYVPGRDALRDVSFAADPGQIVGVLGPNGGGKTTLFRALLGELPVRRGEVLLPGRPGITISPRRTGSSPSSARNSVVLPPPLGPSTATRRPGATSKETARSTSRPGR